MKIDIKVIVFCTSLVSGSAAVRRSENALQSRLVASINLSPPSSPINADNIRASFATSGNPEEIALTAKSEQISHKGIIQDLYSLYWNQLLGGSRIHGGILLVNLSIPLS